MELLAEIRNAALQVNHDTYLAGHRDGFESGKHHLMCVFEPVFREIERMLNETTDRHDVLTKHREELRAYITNMQPLVAQLRQTEAERDEALRRVAELEANLPAVADPV